MAGSVSLRWFWRCLFYAHREKLPIHTCHSLKLLNFPLLYNSKCKPPSQCCIIVLWIGLPSPPFRFPLHMRKPVGPWTLLKAQWAKATLMVIGTCKQLQSMKLSIIFEHLQALLLQVSTRIAGVSPKQTWTSIHYLFIQWTESGTRWAWKTTYLSRTTRSVTNHPMKYSNSQCNFCLCIWLP